MASNSSEKSEYAIQHLKDIKIAIEYKHLAKHAPGGVYLMPCSSLHDIRTLHGVIFVRRGLYREGIFRFVMTLPAEYNDINTHPSIVFTPSIYHPLIDPVSGELNLRVEESLREWVPGKHFILTALVFLKKIFYLKSYDHFDDTLVANETARQQFNHEPSIFLSNVQESVKESLQRIYTEPDSTTCMLRFSAPIPAHDVIKESILADGNSEKNERRNNDNSNNNNTSNMMETNDNVASITKKLEFCYDATNEVLYSLFVASILPFSVSFHSFVY